MDTSQPRLYEPPPIRRTFSPGDVLRLILGLALLVAGVALATVAEDTISGAESDVVEAFSGLPDRVEQAIVGVAQLAAMLFPLGVVLIGLWQRKWRLLVSLWLAGSVATLTTYLLEQGLGQRDSALILSERTISNAWLVDPNFPTTTYIASAAAWVAVGSPWLARRWKRAALSWVSALVMLRIIGSGEPVLDIVLAIAVGVVVGSLVLLVLGSPNQEPSPHELLASLRTAGFDPIAIDRTGDGTVAPRFLLRENGATYMVKLRTPHDRSSDLLNRLYRAVRLRSSEFERPFSTLKRRVEHEALLLKSACDGGVRCPGLMAVGTTTTGSAYLVRELVPGTPAVDLDPDDLKPAVLRDFWRQIATLHGLRIAHGAVSLDSAIVDTTSEEVWLVGMDQAELSATRRDRAGDVAVGLVDLALVVGPEAAVGSARAVMSDDDISAALPLLQPLALPAPVRRRLKAHKSVLPQLRQEVQDRTGAPDIELDKIERFSGRTVVTIVAVSLAFYALLPQIANVDDTVDAFGDARLEWVPAMLLAAIAIYFFSTISFLGSVTQPLPYLGFCWYPVRDLNPCYHLERVAS